MHFYRVRLAHAMHHNVSVSSWGWGWDGRDENLEVPTSIQTPSQNGMMTKKPRLVIELPRGNVNQRTAPSMNFNGWKNWTLNGWCGRLTSLWSHYALSCGRTDRERQVERLHKNGQPISRRFRPNRFAAFHEQNRNLTQTRHRLRPSCHLESCEYNSGCSRWTGVFPLI